MWNAVVGVEVFCHIIALIMMISGVADDLPADTDEGKWAMGLLLVVFAPLVAVVLVVVALCKISVTLAVGFYDLWIQWRPAKKIEVPEARAREKR